MKKQKIECKNNSSEVLLNKDNNIIKEYTIDFKRIVLKKLISPRRQEILDGISNGVIGQEHAKNVLADFIIQALTKVGRKKGTMGNLFFHGPTGVGKTEIVRSLSEFLLGDPEAFIKIDCGELAEAHTKTKLFGAPPSYIGYNDPPLINQNDLEKPFLSAIEKGKLHPLLNNLRSFSIILFDEIEKAHYQVIQSLLGALDQGKVKSTNPNFSDIDLSHTIIIFTSNIGEHSLDIKKEEKRIGFKAKENNIDEDKIIGNAMKDYFSPEFRSRIDALVRFNKLKKEEVLKIIDLFISKLEFDLNSYYKNYPKIKIIFSQDLYNYIFDNFHDESKGIRELERKFNLHIRRKVELLVTLDQFGKKYNNKVGLLNFDFDLDNDEIVLSINEYGIKDKLPFTNTLNKEIVNSVDNLLKGDFGIFIELNNFDYIKVSDLGKYSNYSFIEIYGKKFLVNEKEFYSKINKLKETYKTIAGIDFLNLKKINLNINNLRKIIGKIVENYFKQLNFNVPIEIYTYLLLIYFIKPLSERKGINFNDINQEILIFLATKEN